MKLPMMPHTKGRFHTSVQSFIYSILVFIVSIGFYFFDFVGLTYLCISLLLGLVFLWKSFSLLSDYSNNEKVHEWFTKLVIKYKEEGFTHEKD